MHDANLLSSLLLVFQKRPWVVEGLVEQHQWTCCHVGHGQLVAFLQVSVSWVLAQGVCQKQGLGFIVYH